MLPMAVADNDDAASTFFVSELDGCSSLGRQRGAEALRDGNWTRSTVANRVRGGCAGTAELRSVPTVTLSTILGEWLDGQEVDFMHVDVQGQELAVLRSARNRIQQVPTTDPDPDPIPTPMRS